jgi:phenylalanyl-tRNA synthetase beta chain
LRAEKIRGLLGIVIPVEKVRDQLTRLGCVEISSDDASTTWQPPTFRHDLAREVDLIEELARLHGLAGIPSRLATAPQAESAADRAHHRVGRLRRLLADRGWDECVSDALVERRFAAGADALALANPLSEVQTHLRSSLRASLLQIASRNLAKGVAQLRLFEVGPVYRRNGVQTDEPLHLGLLISGTAEQAHWSHAERAADYFDLTGTAKLLQERLGFAAADCLEMERVGEAEARTHGIKAPVFYAEFSLQEWLQRDPQPERYQPVTAYPPVRRDLAVVVPAATPQARVEEIIREAHAPHLETVELFDLFRDKSGAKIGADQKSLAYALTFRAPDRTLVEREVNEAHESVRQKLATVLGCTFRDS